MRYEPFPWSFLNNWKTIIAKGSVNVSSKLGTQAHATHLVFKERLCIHDVVVNYQLNAKISWRLLHRVRPVVQPAHCLVSDPDMNHDCPKRSPWKCLGYNQAMHSFPSWSGMATSLMSFHKPCWLDFIFKLRVSDSVWTRTSVIFLSTPISLHCNQTHGLHCFAWVFRCVRIWINENNEAVDRRDNSWCIRNRVLVSSLLPVPSGSSPPLAAAYLRVFLF